MYGSSFSYGAAAVSGAAISIYLLILVAFIILQYYIAKWFAKIAKMKGYDPVKEHIVARVFWLGLVGILYTIALPDRGNSKTETETENKTENKTETPAS